MSNDLHTYIEPELEARITALVLSEVGEFDVDELERIIQEQPELQIFRRRMEAMHDLLGDTVNPEKDEAWQLSDDRRAELRRTFSKSPEPARRKSSVITRSQWRSAMGIAACLLVCLVLFSMMTPAWKKGDRRSQSEPAAEIVFYSASNFEDEKRLSESEEDEIVWAAESLSAPAKSAPSRSSRVEKDAEVPTLEDLPQIAHLFKGKKKAEKSKDTSVAHHRSIPKRTITRGVTRKPSAPSSSMAKVIAANTSSNTAIPVPDVDADADGIVPDPSVAFGDGDDFGDGWGDGDMEGKVSGAFGGEKKKNRVAKRELGLKIEGEEFEGFVNLGSSIAQKEIARRGGVKRDLSEEIVGYESGVDVIREFNYTTEYEPPELPNSIVDGSKLIKDGKSEFPVTPARQNVDKVRKSLYTGEGYYNLGKYDEAEAEMKKVLQVDPYNKAARRWLEKVASTKSDYYRAAYDHTRANLLAEVDKAWEMSVPGDRPSSTSGLKAKPATPTIPSPKRPEPLPEETSTSAQPFSTFSLNVSDVSFKLAKVALLEKGQWPEAAKVRTEEFVNAFDYGDASPRRGESVACAIEQAAHPFLQQRNLLRIGMKTAALGRSAPLRLTVLLDNSGSMEREDREASVLAAIRVLASQLGPQDQITLVGFARTPRLLADRVGGDKAGQLVNIVANTPSEGGTNIEEALVLARKLAKRQHSEGAQDRIVLITDGVANLGNTVPEELSRQVEIMRQEGIAFDACGVGAEGLNDEILETLTRKGDGRYYFLNRPEDADSGFAKQLAGALTPAAKNVKVQVVFNPKRVSKYRLLGFNKHRLNKEDFRNDQVDAAEMAAEEAGNAVYQIEVNPNGKGELGEVFVRFLDAHTNRMVERSWPLAYESQVKPFDLTTTSMQLAGVASQLGEKLHNTDAGSVRFQNISTTLGKLRAHYTHNPKVQDLIRMCEKVK